MDFSLLLLVTPMMPPAAAPVAGVPIGDVPSGRAPAGPADGALVCGAVAPGVDAPPPGAPLMPPVAPWFSVSGWNSPFVIGSLYFLRRKRWSTRTSSDGGLAFPNLRLK